MSDVIKMAPPAPAILNMEPEQLADRAIRISKTLLLLVTRGGMVETINDRPYVRVEGWNAMGALMGLSPHVAGVRELEDGSFEACVEIRSRDGEVRASASARCGMDESRWRVVPAFSRRSMAITRATGKAYRIGFSWVMALAGCAETPAEDMPEYIPEPGRGRREEPPHPGEPFRVERRDGTQGNWNGQWPKGGRS